MSPSKIMWKFKSLFAFFSSLISMCMQDGLIGNESITALLGA